jgi:NAD(P)-dependent dehydrogenase (short-subunit alcohol dehydrogenase family)
VTATDRAIASRQSRARRLPGRIALVTGAAGSIGAAIAEAFAREGATVIVTDIHPAGAAELAQRLGGRASARRLDVRDELAWAALMAHVLDAHGRLDVLVNGAGTVVPDQAGRHDPEHACLADWHAVHRSVLDGTFLGCKHALRTMRRARPSGAGGSIVNVLSHAGVVGLAAAAAYASSQAAVRNHSRSVALYCAEQGLPVRCNSVHPPAIAQPEAASASIANKPPRRGGTPDNVAAVAVFLASDQAARLTGAEFQVDRDLPARDAAGSRAAGPTSTIRRSR